MATLNTLTLRDRLRADSVKRWHIVCVNKDQSVAAHSYNVAVISVAILQKLCMDEYWGDRVCRLAMYHDQDEVIYGDIPSVEKTVNWVKIFSGPMEPKHVVKMADVIDAYTWLYHNHADEHASGVVDFLRLRTVSMLDYFRNTLNDRYAIACKAVMDEIIEGKFS